MTECEDQDTQPLAPGEVQRRLDHLAEDVRRRLGPGARLGAEARLAFEGRLGGDLSGVMVHRGPLAGHLARSLGADALSAGEHVLGDDDALDPSTRSGAALLGHELSHVVQRTPADADASADRNEGEAQIVERALAQDGEAVQGAAVAIDVEALAERVYQRLMDQLRRDRDRAAWIP